MADALKVNQTVTDFNIGSKCRSDNSMDPIERADMATAHVDNFRIAFLGALAFAQVLEVNQSLKKLRLHGKCRQ